VVQAPLLQKNDVRKNRTSLMIAEELDWSVVLTGRFEVLNPKGS
jgi:hypothetical protein